MKFTVSLKDPDGFYECVADAVDNKLQVRMGVSKAQLATGGLRELRQEALKDVWDKLSKFVEYKEYVLLEFDTDAGTARVVPIDEF